MLMGFLLGVIIKVGCTLLQRRSKARCFHPTYSKRSYLDDIERLKLVDLLIFFPIGPKLTKL